MNKSPTTDLIIEVIGAQPSYTFHWPEGSEEYQPVIEVAILSIHYSEPFRLFVAYGYRKAYGTLRRRILVFRNEANVLAEFVGVDDWARTKHVATFLRREGSKKHLRIGESIPARYQAFVVVDSQSVITGPYSPRSLVAVVDEANLPSLIAVAMARDEGESSVLPQKQPILEQPAKALESPARTGKGDPRAVVQALLAYRAKQKTGGPLTKNKDADDFLRQNPFAFLMAASIDRGARAEAVWEIPLRLRSKLEHLDPRTLSQININHLENILRSLDRQPRYPRQAAQTISSLSKLVVDKFNGNAEAIWREREPPDVIQILQEIWGVGPGIAHMAVRILLDEFGYDPGPEGRKKIDVKADIHVIRIFYRTGLIQNRSAEGCIQAARQLYSDFPGLLDWPAWEIGRTWCHEHNPDCQGCHLSEACQKSGLK